MALKFTNVALLKGLGIHMADVNVGSNTDVPLTNLHPGAPIQVNDTIIDINGEVYTVTAVTDENVHVSDVIQGITLKGPKGDQGTGLLLKGSVAAEDDLPTENNKAGDAYLVGGELHVWDGGKWVNGGSIKGPSGEGFHTITTAVADDAKVAIADIVPNNSVTVGDSLVDANGDVRPIVATDDTNATLGKKTISLKGVAGGKGDPGEAGQRGSKATFVEDTSTLTDIQVGDFNINPATGVLSTVVDEA